MTTDNAQNQTAASSQNAGTMTHADALQKVAKLLRLAQSDNPHEAALAASRAQEIMDRFKLTGADIQIDGQPAAPSEPVEHFSHDPLDADGSARWKGQLGVVIAKQNQCKLYANRGTLCLIGRASDVQTVRYLYGWMVREIERLAARDCRGCGRTYWNNYRLGAVETVCKRLRESALDTVAAVKAEAVGNARALVLVQKSLAVIETQAAEVESYGKRVLHLRARSASRTNFHSGAREAGRKAGGEVRMNGARAALSSGGFQLH